VSAKPFLERWMSEQIGWRGLVRRVAQEAPNWGVWLPQMPRLMYRALAERREEAIETHLARVARESRRQSWLLAAIAIVLVGILITLAR
jgi:ubiquinone biosynthesis protein